MGEMTVAEKMEPWREPLTAFMKMAAGVSVSAVVASVIKNTTTTTSKVDMVVQTVGRFVVLGMASDAAYMYAEKRIDAMYEQLGGPKDEPEVEAG